MERTTISLDHVAAGAFEVAALEVGDCARVRTLCDSCADADIRFVDAAVLAVAERLGETTLATLDHRHSRVLLPRHVDALRLLPDDA